MGEAALGWCPPFRDEISRTPDGEKAADDGDATDGDAETSERIRNAQRVDKVGGQRGNDGRTQAVGCRREAPRKPPVIGEKLQGVAYGANHCIVSMKKAGYDVKEIYACGGLAQSDFWMQMHADIIGVPMYTTVESQSAGCLGDCIIAAVGVGIYPNFWEAADSMIRVDKEYIPNMEAHKEYQFYMDRYMETWPQMREIVHKTVDHNNKK